MTLPTLQAPSLVLPYPWVSGFEVENINDVARHVGTDMIVESLQEKQVHIMAVEIVTAGVPGNLWCWIELSPYPSSITTAYWAAIGGGGGALAPTAPYIEIGAGVMGRVHTILLPWAIHSPYARVVLQTPVLVATATWSVQAMISGKTP